MTKINTEYDIGKAFEAIEDELIASMIRNMERHKLEEITEDKQWTMWQTEQLQALEKYRKDNQKRFGEKFKEINSRIETLIRTAKDDGNGYTGCHPAGISGRKSEPGSLGSILPPKSKKT